jgi:hypothetical protein
LPVVALLLAVNRIAAAWFQFSRILPLLHFGCRSGFLPENLFYIFVLFCDF